jgi:hypothetical protein
MGKRKYFVVLIVILVAIAIAGFFYWQSLNKSNTNLPVVEQPKNPYEALGKTATSSELFSLIKNIPIDKDATNELIFVKDISDSLKQQTRMYMTKTSIDKILASYKSYLKTQKLPIISEVSKDNYKFLAAGPTNYRITVNINKNKELSLSEVSVTFNYLLLEITSKK